MSTEPKQPERIRRKPLDDWREGESAAARPDEKSLFVTSAGDAVKAFREREAVPPAAAELCGEYVTHVIAGASWINCALPKGHEGGHRGKGTCVKHGEYFGEVDAFPQCPKWPDCIHPTFPFGRVDTRAIVEAVPPAAPTCPFGYTKEMPGTKHECAIHKLSDYGPDQPVSPAAETAHTRNSEVLADFVKYCESHPDKRFWQALRNWSEYHFVFVADMNYIDLTHKPLLDTFYWEGRRHDK